MKHIKQLDSLRGIAVLLVLIHHSPISSFIPDIPTGPIGVNTFFVLSGFLITGILLENRNKAELLGTNKLVVFKNFFFRRALRIFPIYYLTLFLLFIFYSGTDTSKFTYYLTYTSNFYFYKKQAWDGMFSHLWSLSVEEQFYLVWPWAMLLINRKYLIHTIICFIVVGIISQYLLWQSEFNTILTFACFDSLGLGALLAWINMYKPGWLPKTYTILCIAAPIVFITVIAEIITRNWYFLPLRTGTSIFALWVITYVVYRYQTNKSKRFFILDNKILIFVGTISYGIYLYHRIIPFFSPPVFNYINNYLPLNNPIRISFLVIENLFLIIFVSWLSWKFIEKPILNLKKYFGYQDQETAKNDKAL